MQNNIQNNVFGAGGGLSPSVEDVIMVLIFKLNYFGGMRVVLNRLKIMYYVLTAKVAKFWRQIMLNLVIAQRV